MNAAATNTPSNTNQVRIPGETWHASRWSQEPIRATKWVAVLKRNAAVTESNAPARDDDAVAHDVLRSIRRILRRVSEHSRRLVADAGLTLPQLVCLKAIGELQGAGEDEITLVQLSGRVHLSAGTVSRIVERLVRAGLVLRERRARDRRKVCLSLTEQGQARFASLPAPLQDSFLERLRELAPDERIRLLDALERVSELMDAGDDDVAPMLSASTDMT